MNAGNEKCVMILDGGLPAGVIANTAAVMGVTLGMKLPDVVGEDVSDGAGRLHTGIIQFPIPILRGTPEILAALREKLYAPEYAGITVVDFSELAQGCRTYGEFIRKMAACPAGELRYIGLALCGDKKKISSLTGNLPLLR